MRERRNWLGMRISTLGMRDSNGTMIFEGNIVDYVDDDNHAHTAKIVIGSDGVDSGLMMEDIKTKRWEWLDTIEDGTVTKRPKGGQGR